jgi:amino acid permease
MTTSIIRFLNIVIAAILAGTSFGIWMGFNPLNLSPTTYIEQQQNMLRSLNVLMITLVFGATIITIISAVLHRRNKQEFIPLLIASLFFIACIIISRFGNQPINNEIMTRTSGTVPGNLSELRDQWWSFHIIRTISELIALCFITWTSIKKG